jgi:hypothetical protein
LDGEVGDLPGITENLEEVPLVLSHMYADFYGQIARVPDDDLYSYPGVSANNLDYFTYGERASPAGGGDEVRVAQAASHPERRLGLSFRPQHPGLPWL